MTAMLRRRGRRPQGSDAHRQAAELAHWLLLSQNVIGRETGSGVAGIFGEMIGMALRGVPRRGPSWRPYWTPLFIWGAFPGVPLRFTPGYFLVVPPGRGGAALVWG
jgi:hypothetical protein